MNKKSIWYGFCIVMLVVMCSMLFEVIYLTSIAKDIYYSVSSENVEDNESFELEDNSNSILSNSYVNDEFYCPYCDGVLQLNAYSYSKSKAYFSCNCCGYHSPEVKGAIGEEECCKQELKEHFKANDWKKWMDRE